MSRRKPNNKKKLVVPPEQYKIQGARGEVEFIIKDKHGRIIDRQVEPNIIKIFAKEMLAHRLPYSRIWDPDANTGLGDWIDDGPDPNGDFAAKYILFGASFDENGVPLDSNDDRYYTPDDVTSGFIPIRLGPGADYDGSLINAIPIAEPNRPLKRVESVAFEATYQPSGTPLLQSDVRAMNNVLVVETTLRTNEYNGFGLTDSDFFTITEVALAGGKELGSVGACECTPRELFLEGIDGSEFDSAIPVTLSGGDTIALDSSVTDVDQIKEGDQIMLVSESSTTNNYTTLDQISPFYLVLSKTTTGRDIVLDRIPVDSNNNALTGTAGIFRDTLRIFSHRVLVTPVKKSSDFEIITRWRIIFN